MNAILYDVSDFFDSLTLDADRAGHSCKVMLSESTKYSPENQTNETVCMVPCDTLTEDEKDLERDIIRNMEPLLRSAGLAICRQASEREQEA